MRKIIKEIDSITARKVPVPPMLAKAIGYNGEARFVSFQWTPYGDEADYSDGRLSGTGNWQAFLAYIQHPAVSPFLKEYDLGSSDSEARHVLILDRNKLEILISSVKEAQAFLSALSGPVLIRRWRRRHMLDTSAQDTLAFAFLATVGTRIILGLNRVTLNIIVWVADPLGESHKGSF